MTSFEERTAIQNWIPLTATFSRWERSGKNSEGNNISGSGTESFESANYSSGTHTGAKITVSSDRKTVEVAIRAAAATANCTPSMKVTLYWSDGSTSGPLFVTGGNSSKNASQTYYAPNTVVGGYWG